MLASGSCRSSWTQWFSSGIEEVYVSAATSEPGTANGLWTVDSFQWKDWHLSLSSCRYPCSKWWMWTPRYVPGVHTVSSVVVWDLHATARHCLCGDRWQSLWHGRHVNHPHSSFFQLLWWIPSDNSPLCIGQLVCSCQWSTRQSDRHVDSQTWSYSWPKATSSHSSGGHSMRFTSSSSVQWRFSWGRIFLHRRIGCIPNVLCKSIYWPWCTLAPMYLDRLVILLVVSLCLPF